MNSLSILVIVRDGGVETDDASVFVYLHCEQKEESNRDK